MIDNFAFPLEELEFFLLILTRVSAFLFTAPFFSQNNVPRMLKAALSVFISYLLYEAIMPHEYPIYNSLYEYTGLLLKETLTGLIIGLAGAFAMNVTSFAGQVVDTELGLAMASQMDPVTMQNTTVTGYFYQYTFMLIFMVTGMHRYLLQALGETFTLIPVGKTVFEMESFYNDMIEFMGTYIMLGFRIALPVFAVILIVNCMLGVMAKVSPQMNMFAVGIQIKAMVGMVVIFITVRVLPKAADMVFVQMKTNIATVVKAMMPG